jgi:hypothetical protein
MLLESRDIAATKRHGRRVGQLVAALRKQLEHLVLARRIPAVRLKDHRERREPIAVVVRDRATELGDETQALGFQRLASAHRGTRTELGTLLE